MLELASRCYSYVAEQACCMSIPLFMEIVYFFIVIISWPLKLYPKNMKIFWEIGKKQGNKWPEYQIFWTGSSTRSSNFPFFHFRAFTFLVCIIFWIWLYFLIPWSIPYPAIPICLRLCLLLAEIAYKNSQLDLFQSSEQKRSSPTASQEGIIFVFFQIQPNVLALNILISLRKCWNQRPSKFI